MHPTMQDTPTYTHEAFQQVNPLDEILKYFLQEVTQPTHNFLQSSSTMTEEDVPREHLENSPENTPYVKIVEEPASNLYRFRYRSEGDTAGTIPGLKQENERRSFPKIMVCNHEGPALLEICCLTEDLRVHPNNLVWRKEKRKNRLEASAGIYRAEITGNRTEEIRVGVNLSKKHDILNLLSVKQELGVDPFNKGYSHAEEGSIRQLDLTRVRLGFKVSIRGYQSENEPWQPLPPVYSQVICHNTNMVGPVLRIRDISDTSSSSLGGEKKIVLFDKVDPTGLEVVLYDQQSGWTGLGEFSPADVHHKSSMVFRTPAYPGIDQVTTVSLQLRKGGGAVAPSNYIQFTYYPHSRHQVHPSSVPVQQIRETQSSSEIQNHQRCCEAEQRANSNDNRQTDNRQGLFMRGSVSNNLGPRLGRNQTYTYQD